MTSLSPAARGRLADLIAGPVFTPGDDAYAVETAGFNLTLPHRPSLVVGATGPADVQHAVRFAADHDLAVAVHTTGHGAVVSADGSLMITTRRMSGVTVDAPGRSARVQGGVRWDQVIPAAAVHGLAGISGSSPQVGTVGFTLGGGLSPVFGRTRGFGADHVRAFDIVTADGQLRHVTADREPDLFWAARGGKGNFGVVTALEFGLFPISRLYGGGLFFTEAQAPAVLDVWRQWAPTVPENLSTSFCLLRLPGDPLILHVRIAFLGSTEEGAALIAPLRAAAPAFQDTVAEMPYTATATIHNDPTEPGAGIDRSALLRDLPRQALDTLLSAPEDDLMMTEIRLLGGALQRPPAVPAAVGNRQDAAYCLFTASIPAPVPGDAERIREAQRRLLERMAPWSTGGAYANFQSTEDTGPAAVRAAFAPDSWDRLLDIKKYFDPANLFRINHNIRR
ncbi:FAD-binding oxidoreductase [Actinoplanes rectilineatus]|uniref:FAD-binding oxidoreductase n=1 Tax=Actinoplanes rectilineatus TaxID=113571 RepID=UPI0005F2A2C0|nr:FAD-binding oxidoreductase [Actinoplanes rectilineatus]